MLLREKFFENRARIFLALLLPTLLIYLKSLGYSFTTMDEQWMIVKNDPYLKTVKSFTDAFISPLAGMYYRPVFLCSIILDYQVGQLNPFIYHLSNLLWHLGAVLLFYRFLELYGGNKKSAFVFALLFSVHPVLLHAVAWVPGRNDVMLAVFSLASLNSLKRYLDTEKNKFLLFHLIFLALALFTKESAFVLPVIFVAVLLALKKFSLKDSFHLLCFWTAFAACWFYIRKNAVTYTPGQADFYQTLKNFAEAMLGYTGKSIIPVKLSVFPTVKNSLLWPGVASLILIAILFFKPGTYNRKMAFLGLFIFFMILFFPVWFSSVSAAREHYEHRIYLSMAGLALFFCSLKIDFRKKISELAVLAVFIFFSIYTFKRMDVYKNEESFLDRAILECPDFYLFPLQRAEMFYEGHNYDKALALYTKAIELRPDKKNIYNNRGSAYYHLGRNKEAAEDFTQAISGEKFEKEYYLNRCAAYYAMGDITNAMKDLLVLIKCCRDILPPDMEKQVTEKWVSLELSKLNKEIEESPGNAELYFRRSKIWIGIGETQKAVKDLEKANSLDPDNEEYLKLLLKEKGKLLGV